MVSRRHTTYTAPMCIWPLTEPRHEGIYLSIYLARRIAMLPRAPDAGAAASPGRVVDVLRTIQVPTARPTPDLHPTYT